MRLAICMLIVANGESTPTVDPLEDVFDREVRGRKNLILLWPEYAERPVNTQRWLDLCGWAPFYHIRAPYRMYIPAWTDPRKVDAGRAIGLVLGGGGARGASHLGILRALKEQNVPIDIVGGVTFGSFVGGLYCSDPDIGRVIQKAREWFMEMSLIPNYLADVTLPFTSVFSGDSFNAELQEVFGDRLIEDTWIPTDISASQIRVHRNADVMRSMGVSKIIAVDVGSEDETNWTNYGDSLNGFWVLLQRINPWAKPMRVLSMAEIQSRLSCVCGVRQLEELKKAPYCYYNVGLQHGKAVLRDWICEGKLAVDTFFNITTDITASQMRVHRNGPLWRYCRASMSIGGLLPPMCDPNDDHQLLDGGYVNNLPADVMRNMGVSKIIAVDVGSQDETNLTNYGDSLNGFWVLLQRINPWAKPMRVLSMAEIQSRLSCVSGVRQLEEVKKAPYCYYVRPPIDEYKTLDFALFDEICNVGLQRGKALLHEWKCEGKLAELLRGGDEASEDDHRKERRCHIYRSPQSFTDLAAYVSKIEPRHQWSMLSDVSDEETDEMDGLEETQGNVG